MKLQKKLLTGLSVILCLSNALAVFAKDELVLTLQEDGTFSYNSSEKVQGSDNQEYVKFGSSFEGMAPGETRTEKMILKNECETADFYISTATLDAFEEGNIVTGGAYEIELIVGDNVIYSSELGGYTDREKKVQGLEELNNSLDGYVFATTLNAGESTEVSFTLTLDGESLTDVYQSKSAEISFDYQAMYKAVDVVNVERDAEVKTVDREKKEYVYVTTTQLEDEAVPLFGIPTGVVSAKTSDTWEVVGIAALLIVAAGVFYMTRKKKKETKQAE